MNDKKTPPGGLYLPGGVFYVDLELKIIRWRIQTDFLLRKGHRQYELFPYLALPYWELADHSV